MVEITIDGNKVEVPDGSMVMHAAQKAGLYVPHFCYHKKLSIAANCRMCLVEVEKAPKALPACATPCANGMVVFTQSEKAIQAQKSVMEFLLINHPLDCPICDQGGECQLQDLAVGYGGVESRYTEEKRVVFHKSLGPLVSAEEMSRCIQCTRCVRFGQEIAGMMELGMLNRGEHSEITSFVGRAVESELSGNMIDICPVGALTSKPFRYSARTWELARRKSVSPHDSLGTNVVVQVKNDRAMRVVPYENDAINECWISDRDRFSYEGLSVEDRLTDPMVRQADGTWKVATWAEALNAAATGIHQVVSQHGSTQLGALAANYSTLEEFSLLARLMKALNAGNIDFRLRQEDTEFDEHRADSIPWLGMPVASVSSLDKVVIIGSFLRKDHPLLAQRLRQATKQGSQVYFIDSVAQDPLFEVSGRMTVAPSAIPLSVAEVLVAVCQIKSLPVPAELASVSVSSSAQQIAESLVTGSNIAVMLGNLAMNHPEASTVMANAQALSQALGARLSVLTEGANTVGAYLAGAVPARGAKSAQSMLQSKLKSYVVLHVEPELDCANPVEAINALKAAQFNVALTSYKSAAQAWAHVMLPVSPYTETSGTFVSAEGRVQSFKATVRPLGQTRPAWKVLRVLANTLNLANFDDESSEAVRDLVVGANVVKLLSNRTEAKVGLGNVLNTLERVADVPIYASDVMSRRAASLQLTPAAAAAKLARANSRTLASLGLTHGDRVHVKSATGVIELTLSTDDAVADSALLVSAAQIETMPLGCAFGEVLMERAK